MDGAALVVGPALGRTDGALLGNDDGEVVGNSVDFDGKGLPSFPTYH